MGAFSSLIAKSLTAGILVAAASLSGCSSESEGEDICVLNEGLPSEVEGLCCTISGGDGVCVEGMCTNGQRSAASEICDDGRVPRQLPDSGIGAGGAGGAIGGSGGAIGGSGGAVGGNGGAVGGAGGAVGGAGGGGAGAGGAVGGAGGEAGGGGEIGGAGGEAGGGGEIGGAGGGAAGAGGAGGGVVNDAAIGDACGSDDDCLGGPNDLCIPASTADGPTGFEGGYCSRANCAGADPCPAGSECVQVDQAGNTLCLDLCAANDPCRAGYECADLGGAAACLPMEDEPAPVTGEIGSACAQDVDCGEGEDDFCLPEVDEAGAETGWPGGYCVQLACSDVSPCPDGSECFQVTAEGDTACFDTCGAGDPCRDGYECDAELAACLPIVEDEPEPEPGVIGGACAEDVDCGEGVNDVCMPELDDSGEETGFVGGYCLTFECSDVSPCPDGSECFQVTADGLTACLDLCDANDPCRDGYICDPVDESLSVCFPPADEPNPDEPGDGTPGAACAEDVDCVGGTGLDICLPAVDDEGADTGWSGGYCSALCDAFTPCPDGSECFIVDDAGNALCFATCANNAECRGGYVCDPDLEICLPACQADADCGDGFLCNVGTGLCEAAP